MLKIQRRRLDQLDIDYLDTLTAVYPEYVANRTVFLKGEYEMAFRGKNPT